MKNLHQFSPQEERERRYPFLVAIDLLLHFVLSIAAIALTVIAFTMVIEAILPGLVRFPRF